jgi:hypothetical protein
LRSCLHWEWKAHHSPYTTPGYWRRMWSPFLIPITKRKSKVNILR